MDDSVHFLLSKNLSFQNVNYEISYEKNDSLWYLGKDAKISLAKNVISYIIFSIVHLYQTEFNMLFTRNTKREIARRYIFILGKIFFKDSFRVLDLHVLQNLNVYLNYCKTLFSSYRSYFHNIPTVEH